MFRSKGNHVVSRTPSETIFVNRQRAVLFLVLFVAFDFLATPGRQESLFNVRTSVSLVPPQQFYEFDSSTSAFLRVQRQKAGCRLFPQQHFPISSIHRLPAPLLFLQRHRHRRIFRLFTYFPNGISRSNLEYFSAERQIIS
jgi:hypothetical protein